MTKKDNISIEFLPKCEEFEVTIADYICNYSKASKASSLLSAPRYTVKHTKQTARVISHWIEQSVMNDSRKDESGWHKFSIVDLAWVEIVNELRRYGLPIKTLKRAYQTMHISPNGKSSPQFEAGISLAMLGKPIYVLVFKNGNCQLSSQKCLSQFYLTVNILQHKSFVLIDLRQLLREHFNLKCETDYDSQFINVGLTEKEAKILADMRNPEITEINVVKKDGEVSRFKKTSLNKNPKELEQLKSILAPLVGEHGEFKGKISDGVITYVETTEAKKV